MLKQETIQEIYNRQQWVGNSSISKKEIALILEQLTRKSVNLMKKQDMLVRQKTRVDIDIKRTEDEIKRTKERLDIIIRNDKHVSISLKKQKKKQYIKGRFWWEGKQRDVQIGSEKTIITLLKNLRKNQLIRRLTLKHGTNLSWKFIQTDQELTDAVRTIGGIKVTGYILNKVKKEGSYTMNSPKEDENYDHIEKNVLIYSRPMKKEKSMEMDWYEEWKNENFGEIK
ncbi:MAG: hypothetical protein VX767_03700 [Candidatus Neomarinimicrobiota bacterium]|nr:hypothetical protein [Candidatus Neomarinimicrobiota bacterium]